MRKIVVFSVFLLASFTVGALTADFVSAKAPAHKPYVSRTKNGITFSFSEKTYKEKEKIQVPVDSNNPFVLKSSGGNINLLTGKDVEQKFKTETYTYKTTMVTITVKNSTKDLRDLRILLKNANGFRAQWDVMVGAKGLVKKGKDTYVMTQEMFNLASEIEVYEYSAADKGYI